MELMTKRDLPSELVCLHFEMITEHLFQHRFLEDEPYRSHPYASEWLELLRAHTNHNFLLVSLKCLRDVEVGREAATRDRTPANRKEPPRCTIYTLGQKPKWEAC